MKLIDIYKTAVEFGKQRDPRGIDRIKKELEQIEKSYNEMPEKKKKYFDKEKLSNPYSDTRILNGSGEEEIKTILAGIDMEIGEILLADRLSEKGKKIDLVMSHHPEDKALASLADVMKLQSDVHLRHGVPISLSEALMEERMQEVNRRLMPINHSRAIDAAKLLGFPFICVHTPADNGVTKFLSDLFDERKPDTLGDIIDILNELPEYQQSSAKNVPPVIISGSESRRCGKIMVDMTGGTEGPKNIFEGLKNSNVNTLVCMHLSEEHLKEAKNNHLNVIIAGHIASDSLGLNLFLDELLKKEDIEIIPCSGFIRVKRI